MKNLNKKILFFLNQPSPLAMYAAPPHPETGSGARDRTKNFSGLMFPSSFFVFYLSSLFLDCEDRL
jgi:hypothetical protein